MPPSEPEASVTLFHVTNAVAASLRDGFREADGSYMTDQTFKGVWLSDRPFDSNEGVLGDVVLSVTLPPGTDLSDYEWIEAGKTYREWLVPAALLNARGLVRRVP